MSKVRPLKDSNPQPSPSKSDARSVTLCCPETAIALRKFFRILQNHILRAKKYRVICIDLEILATKPKCLQVEPQIVALILNQFTCNICTYAQMRLTLFSIYLYRVVFRLTTVNVLAA